VGEYRQWGQFAAPFANAVARALREPVSITVVGRRGDAAAAALWRASGLTADPDAVRLHPDPAVDRNALAERGFPPGRAAADLRAAREPPGSCSPQGAVIGAVVGMALVLSYVVFGGEPIRQNPGGIILGGFAIVVGLTFIGWLAGRARVFKEDEYATLEDDVAEGDTLLSVVCETPDGADQTRAILERSGAREVKLEESGESV